MAGPGHTDTQEAGHTHGQRRRRARAQLTAGQRSDECPGGGEQALHPTARAGGRRPRGGWSGRPLVATPAARPRPLPGCRCVRPWVSASPRPRAVPRRPRRPPNFQRRPAPRPRRRLGVSIAGPRALAQSAGLRGPMALAACARAPRPRRRRLPRAAPRCSLAVPGHCPPPCAPRPAGSRSPPAPSPLGGPAPAPPPPPTLAPRLSAALLPPSPHLSPLPPRLSPCLPAGSPSPSRSPSQPPPRLPQPLPSLSPARRDLSLAPCLSSVTLSLALPARSPLSRTQAPAAASSPACPGARAPAARGAPRTPNSPHAAPLCETFAPPRT